jgi:hypothetical protein
MEKCKGKHLMERILYDDGTYKEKCRICGLPAIEIITRNEKQIWRKNATIRKIRIG